MLYFTLEQVNEGNGDVAKKILNVYPNQRQLEQVNEWNVDVAKIYKDRKEKS